MTDHERECLELSRRLKELGDTRRDAVASELAAQSQMAALGYELADAFLKARGFAEPLARRRDVAGFAITLERITGRGWAVLSGRVTLASGAELVVAPCELSVGDSYVVRLPEVVVEVT